MIAALVFLIYVHQRMIVVDDSVSETCRQSGRNMESTYMSLRLAS